MVARFESIGNPIKILENGIEDIKKHHLKYAVYYENYPKVERYKKEINTIRESIRVLEFYKAITDKESK